MENKVNQVNNSFIYLKNHNMKVTEVKEGYAVIELTVTDNILNPYDMVHGGNVYSLADTCAGVAAHASGRTSVTLNANINYIRPAKGEKIIATATRVSEGRTTCVYEVDVCNLDGKLAAKATFTMYFTS